MVVLDLQRANPGFPFEGLMPRLIESFTGSNGAGHLQVSYICLPTIIMWWFLVIVPGFQGTPALTPIGPFAVQAQCEKYRHWVNDEAPHQYVSDCWSDEDP